MFATIHFFELTTKDTKYTNKYKAEDIIPYPQTFFVPFVFFVVPSICILVPTTPDCEFIGGRGTHVMQISFLQTGRCHGNHRTRLFAFHGQRQ